MARRVHIIGGAGSGKTTLASTLSCKHGLPHRKLDEAFWANIQRHEQRPQAERDKVLDEWISEDAWVLDGIFWQSWVRPAFDRADLIVLLDIPEFTRHFRVIKRHLGLLMENPGRDYRYFFPTLMPLIQLNRTYGDQGFEQTLANLADFSDKLVICRTNQDTAAVLGEMQNA